MTTAAQRRYFSSAKGKATKAAYAAGAGGKATSTKYAGSAKGQRAKLQKLLKRYGITAEQYAALGDKCHACGASSGAMSHSVDHDHVTGRVRGLLCVGCNTALGSLKDSPDRIRKLLDYIKGQLR